MLRELTPGKSSVTISSNIPANKLNNFLVSIIGEVVKWIRSYLTGHSKLDKINSVLFTPYC